MKLKTVYLWYFVCCVICLCHTPEIPSYNVNWYRNESVRCVVFVVMSCVSESPQIEHLGSNNRHYNTNEEAPVRVNFFSLVFFSFFILKSQIGWALAMGNVILCRDVEEVKFNSPWFLFFCLLLWYFFLFFVGSFVDSYGYDNAYRDFIVGFCCFFAKNLKLDFLAIYAQW